MALYRPRDSSLNHPLRQQRVCFAYSMLLGTADRQQLQRVKKRAIDRAETKPCEPVPPQAATMAENAFQGGATVGAVKAVMRRLQRGAHKGEQVSLPKPKPWPTLSVDLHKLTLNLA